MGDAATVSESPTTRIEPYARSWLDRWQAFVDRLPGSYWAWYLGLWLLVMAAETAIKWIDGSLALWTVHLPLLGFTGWGLYALAAGRLLDGYALNAFNRLTPLLIDDEGARRRLLYRLTTQPAGWTLAASLAFVGWGALAVMRNPTTIEVQRLYTSPAATVLEIVVLIVSHFIGGALLYKLVHQLSVVGRLHRSFATIDLFRTAPLHRLSGITVRAAFALLLINYAWIAPAPRLLDSNSTVLLLAGLGALAFALFLWPLWGTHRLLLREKGRQLAEIDGRIADAIAALHGSVEGNDPTRLAVADTTLRGLETARRLVGRVSTWPWRPETPRLLITAILLPIGLSLLQRLLVGLLF